MILSTSCVDPATREIRPYTLPEILSQNFTSEGEIDLTDAADIAEQDLVLSALAGFHPVKRAELKAQGLTRVKRKRGGGAVAGGLGLAHATRLTA